ncbi:small GTPase [Naegleria gruberi]|uniref:Small GTPase n=1 Tax=Naegleria gruberi TaxID=5762 RepID=D2W3X6_NAEGR|nr:small GTPase [Naegleria gruberi]EFC36213.1 small GTPase [Naegleria gruberi]|eukprot:XP_002668957.1 small GTPase [Naegleria gruberi]
MQRHNTSGKVGGLLAAWEKRTEESTSSTSQSFRKSSSTNMNQQQQHSIKLCIVGNSTSGKTSLALSFKEDDRDLPHTTLDEFNLKTMYQGKELTLTICDSKGSDDYDRYRTKLTYPNTNVFIICYSIVSKQQYESVKLKWIPEIRMLCPNALIILCATKTDLRDDHRYISSGLLIDRVQVKKLMDLYNHDQQYPIMFYNECSIYDQNVGVKDILDRAIQLSLHRQLNNIINNNNLNHLDNNNNTNINSNSNNNNDKKKK